MNVVPSKLTRITQELLAIPGAPTTADCDLTDALSKGLGIVQNARMEISEVNGALDTLLLLLAAAETDVFSGDQLNCLIAPIQAKLARALERLDDVL